MRVPHPDRSGSGWNVHGELGDWDDREFTSRLIEDVMADFRVDIARVHATGFSLGGMMAQGLTCRLPHRIASIASVAAAMPDMYFEWCQTARSVSVAEFHVTQGPVHSITEHLVGV